MMELGLLEEYNTLRMQLYLLLDKAQEGFYDYGRVRVDEVKAQVASLPFLFRPKEDTELMETAIKEIDEQH
jgi:hypothetical protein